MTQLTGKNDLMTFKHAIQYECDESLKIFIILSNNDMAKNVY